MFACLQGFLCWCKHFQLYSMNSILGLFKQQKSSSGKLLEKSRRTSADNWINEIWEFYEFQSQVQLWSSFSFIMIRFFNFLGYSYFMNTVGNRKIVTWIFNFLRYLCRKWIQLEMEKSLFIFLNFLGFIFK